MKRDTGIILALVAVAVAGWGSGEIFVRSRFGGETLARFWEARPQLAVERALQRAARSEAVSADETTRALELLRAEYGDPASFERALRSSRLSLGDLREEIADNLRARGWIEQQIAPQLAVSEAEARAFYEKNREQFLRPLDYRVAHLFLAAPDSAPDEVKTEKLNQIIGLSVRLLAGESFPRLVGEASEDEASKTRGGDLGFLSAARLPPEFFEEVQKLRRGEVSAPFRSHLGFHLAELTAVRPARELSYEEARGEVFAELAKEKRAAAIAELTAQLAQQK